MSSAMGAMASSRGVKTCVMKMDSARSARGATARARAQAPAQGSLMRRERRTMRTNVYRHAFATGEAMDEAALKEFLDGLKYDVNGFVVAIAQDVDTGAILMQGFADRTAVEYTLKNRKATFWSRSQKKLWTKGETSGNFIEVQSVHLDCDRDSLIYLGIPSGPTCHTGAHTCYYKRVDGVGGAAAEKDGGRHAAEEALTTLYELEATIEARRVEQVDDDAKPSWTRRLLDNPELLCKKIREEAGELCQTWEEDEGKQAATNEMADVLYHSMVMLNKQGVPMSDVLAVLRQRFGTSGVAEKASRAPKK